MSEDLHDIDDLFRDAIENFEDSPSEKVWNAIDKNLDLEDVGIIKKKYKNLKALAAILILLLFGTLVYNLSNINPFKSNRNIPENNQTANSGVKKINEDFASDNVKIQNTLNEKGTMKSSELKNAPFAEKKDGSPLQNSSNRAKKEFIKTAFQKSESKELVNNREKTKSKFSRKTSAKTSVTITKNEAGVETTDTEESIKLFDHAPAELIIVSKEPVNKIILVDKNNFPSVHSSSYLTKNDTKKQNKKISPFSLTAFFSPDIVKLHLKDNESLGSSADLHEIKEGEYENLSFSTGVSVDYSVNKKWSIQSGVVYNSYSYAINPKKLFANVDGNGNIKYKFESSVGYLYLNPKTGTNPVVGDSTYTNESTAMLNYISLPLSLKYNIPYRKFSFYISAGASLNILTGSKIKTEIEGSNENETIKTNDIYGLRSSYFSGNIAFGSAYKITNHFSVTLSPFYNFALNPITKHCSIKSYPNTMGIDAGVKYNF